MAGEQNWKIPFSGNLGFARYIVLKKSVATHKLGTGSPLKDVRMRVVVKEGRDDGFFVKTTEDNVRIIIDVLNGRAREWWGASPNFQYKRVEEPNDTYTEQEVDDLIGGIHDQIEAHFGAHYANALKNLSDQITSLVDKVAETERALEEERRKIKQPTPAELRSIYIARLLEQVKEVADIYNFLCDGIGGQRYTVDELLLASRTIEDVLKDNFPGIDTKGMLSRAAVSFENSGTAPFSAAEYVQTKAERDALLQAISNAPEIVRETIKTSIQGELDRKQERIEAYEKAQDVYETEASRFAALKHSIVKTKGQHVDAQSKIGRDTIASVELIKGQLVYIIIEREADAAVAITAYSNPNRPHFNRDVASFVESVARGQNNVLESKQAPGRSTLVVRGDGTDGVSDIQREIYNRIYAKRDETRFAELGVIIEPVILA